MKYLHFGCIFHTTGISIFYVILLILSIILIYAAISFAFISTFFESDQFCQTLFECTITVMRGGLVDGAVSLSLAMYIFKTDSLDSSWPAIHFSRLLWTLTYRLDIFCDSGCCFFGSYCSSLDRQVL